MAIDCLHEPAILAFGKAFGASLGIFAAALAWLLNNAIRWLVWLISEWRREYELIKALRAEIASNSSAEGNWSDAASADQLLASLKSDLGPYKPWTPYVAVIEGNQVFDSAKPSISRLPANAIEKLVAYYNLTSGLTTQLADFRSEAYAGLSHQRQTKVIREVYALGAEVQKAAQTALDGLNGRLEALRILYGLGIAVGALALFIGVPSALGTGRALWAYAVTPAVEWASSCDLAPRNKPAQS